MKLFDRSVDLAQFEENTPLYPICRAWMANKPRSFVNSKYVNQSLPLYFSFTNIFCLFFRYDKDPFKKVKKEETRDKDKKGKSEDGAISNVYSLPSPLPAEVISFPIAPPSPKTDLKLPGENVRLLLPQLNH